MQEHDKASGPPFRPNRDPFLLALLAYVLLVVVFALVYHVFLPAVTEQPALVFSQAGRTQPTTFLHALYFSVVTQTTVGIGDIIPRGNPAKAVVALQALTGYGFIVLLVSSIVYRRLLMRGL